jgi:hypothetical protein
MAARREAIMARVAWRDFCNAVLCVCMNEWKGFVGFRLEEIASESAIK